MSYTGLNPTFSGTVTSGAVLQAGTGIDTTTGDIIATAGNLTLPNTNGAETEGEIIIGGNRFLSNFGSFSCFFGQISGNASNTGANNVGIGYAALNSLTSGSENVSIGGGTLYLCNSGSGNTAIGDAALELLTTGSNNVAIGSNATDGSLDHLTTGSNNVVIGPASGIAYTSSESSNILLSNVGVVSESNVIRIGTQGSGAGQQNAAFIAGIHGVTVAASTAVLIDANGQMGTVLSSERFKENIKDMPSTNVMKLRPVTFNYKSDESKSKQFGLIAEEVDKVMPEIVLYDDNKQPHSVQYHVLPAILLSEIQKLNKRIEALEKK